MSLTLIPIKYKISELCTNRTDVFIERRINENIIPKWVCSNSFGQVLNKSYKWEYEPQTWRSDVFIKRTRFDSPQEILNFLENNNEIR